MGNALNLVHKTGKNKYSVKYTYYIIRKVTPEKKLVIASPKIFVGNFLNTLKIDIFIFFAAGWEMFLNSLQACEKIIIN